VGDDRSGDDRYRRTLDNLLEGFQIISPDWRYLYVNDAAARHGRTTKERLLGRTMMEAYPGIESTGVFSSMRRCLAEQTAIRLENEFIFPDGSHGWFELSLQPVAEGLVILSEDITDRKRAERRTQNLSRLYATLNQVNQTIVHLKDRDELFRSICAIAVDLGQFGLAWVGLIDGTSGKITPIHVHGTTQDLPLIQPIDLRQEPFRDGLMDRALKTGKITYSSDSRTDPGMPLWTGTGLPGEYRSAAAVPFSLNGDVVGLLNLYASDDKYFSNNDEQTLLSEIGSNISFAMETIETETRRKQAEESLMKSEAQFRLISENVADMIALLDLDGKRLYNSPSYRPVIGDPGSLRDTDSFQEIHPEDRDRIRGVFRDIVTTGVGRTAEYRFQLPDGSIRHIESQGSAIRDARGEVARVLVVARDVTEKKILEKQFLRAQRMESIGTLAGGIAHDLNNILSPILLSLDIFSKKLHDEQSKTILQMLESATTRGTDLIKQVLSFARGIEGERTLVQVRHLIHEIEKIINETFPKSVNFRTELLKNLPAISGDATQLHQVLMNLCVNARDAMPDGGKIHVKAETAVLDEHYARMNVDAKRGEYVVVTVKDQGQGIPPEILDRIFEPFFTTKEYGKGTGLGLSTVVTIVKSHGGFVTVDSEVGKGTTFKVYLPAQEGTQAAVPAERSPLPTGEGELILVVDDEASIREITKTTLEAYGYSVLTAADGTEALGLYAKHGNEIPLIITDMMMPYMDGAATIRAIHKMDPGVKFIAVSGFKLEGDLTARDSVVFLQKPYTSETLLNLLHQQLHRK